MNLADMSSLLTLLIVATAIPGAANSGGAPFWLVLLLVPISIGLGMLAALLNGRVMYRFLGVNRPNQTKSEGNLFIYMAWPFVWWTTTMVVAIAFGAFVASFMRE